MTPPKRRKGAAGSRMTTAPEETLEKRAAAKPPGAIIVARHGEPDCDRTVRIDWRDYIEWWDAYDRSGLAPNQAPSPALVAAAANADVFFASPLRRAVETAAAVSRDRQAIIDEVFVEAPLPPPPLWGRRTPRAWGVYARISWWLGRAAGRETRRAAEQRAEAAVATLTARALRGETVVLVAHGWFNRMMRPVLKRQGWREVEDHGDTYWSFRRYEKRP